MKNLFFNAALNKAARMAGKPGRLILLVSQLVMKLRGVNMKDMDAGVGQAKTKFFILGRLIKAYANGSYRAISWKTMLSIVAAVIYFVNPIDLLPDVLPVIGLTDDVGILVWVYNSVSTEIDKFLTWEQQSKLTI
jgi:uncharacterized membrane protein YkvA (DUF1232 family)